MELYDRVKAGYYPEHPFERYKPEDYKCFRCYGRINFTDFQKRIDARKLLRIKVEGAMRTFHPYCFKLYANENPEWYKEFKKEVIE